MKTLLAKGTCLAMISFPSTVCLAQNTSVTDSQEAASPQIELPAFSEVDQDQNGTVAEEEFQQAASLVNAAESAQTSFSQIDRDSNQSLDSEEYATFQTSVQQNQTTGQAATTDPEATTGQAETKVKVQEKPAEVEVQTQPPTVIVQQPKPEVNIKQPKPEVTIEQPKTDVVVEEQEPDVSVTREGEPQVKYQTKTAGEDILEMTAQDLSGKEVFNIEGNKVGTISKVVSARKSNELGAVVASGGVLGIGATDFVIPLQTLTMQEDRLVWQGTASKEEIDALEDYSEETFADVEQADRPLRSLIAH